MHDGIPATITTRPNVRIGIDRHETPVAFNQLDTRRRRKLREWVQRKPVNCRRDIDALNLNDWTATQKR
jgi:hypothetical protein